MRVSERRTTDRQVAPIPPTQFVLVRAETVNSPATQQTFSPLPTLLLPSHGFPSFFPSSLLSFSFSPSLSLSSPLLCSWSLLWMVFLVLYDLHSFSFIHSVLFLCFFYCYIECVNIFFFLSFYLIIWFFSFSLIFFTVLSFIFLSISLFHCPY